ncbi:helix-turn-helix domain-containing protein [Micromonospora sp. NPDC000668]|uniref:helix-turn-helix domain-containing protein n=1 Tax=Micromonospora sp. NPDC000668 TaxID=3364219 RepID=UPI0036A364FF
MVDGDGLINVGAALRSLRRRADLSQRELAERSGVPKSTLARIEAGRGGDPGFRTVERLIRAAGGEVAFAVPSDAHANAHPSAAHPNPRRSDVEPPDEPRDQPRDEPRDEAGRRYPAHLDVRPVRTLKDWPGAWWAYSYTLPPELWPLPVPEWTYDLDRARRDEKRRRQRMLGRVSYRRDVGGAPETSRRFLAELSDGEIVGELRAHERSVDLLLGDDLGDRRELVLESVVVVPELRWLGIGRRLVELLVAEMTGTSIRTVHAIAEYSIVDFLLACGFELEAARPSALALRL